MTRTNQTDEIALSVIEFFDLASKLMPIQYDGSYEKLQSFLDSLSLFQAHSDVHAEYATAFIKTRLIGKAQDLISDNLTIEEMLEILKNNINGDSSKIVSVKLLHLKQGTKDANTFSQEIDSLAHAHKRAYITEGVSPSKAEAYATDAVVTALIKNAASDRTRLIIEAGTFTSIQQVITKFVSIDNTPSNSSAIFYSRQKYLKSYNRQRFQNRSFVPNSNHKNRFPQ